MTNDKSEKISTDLSELIKGDCFTDILHRAAFSTDAGFYQIIPMGVVAPRDTEDVVAVVKYARDNAIPLAPRGAGSGVAGESLCSGIVLDMRRYMNRILSIADQGRLVICEPGVVLSDLNNRLAEFGRKIGPDPSSANRAVIGGCLANNATGAHSLQYGYFANYVESVEAVLADGSTVEFKNDFDPQAGLNTKEGSIAKQCLDILSNNQSVIEKASVKSRRNRCGYNIAQIVHNGKIDMAKLMASSEGTLAVFTKITLTTVPIPPADALIVFDFDSLDKMAQAVPIIVDTGASMCELMDKILIDIALDAYPQYSDILPSDAAALLFVQHTGQSVEEVKKKIEQTDSAVGQLAKKRRPAFDKEQQKQISKARNDAGPLLFRKKGKKQPIGFIEDTSVDNSRLAEYISALQQIQKQYEFSMSFYGHAGDGELHMRPYLDLSDPAEAAKMYSIADEVFRLVWSLGGSISGEHGNGLVKTAFIRGQYGDEYYEILKTIKNIFDPAEIMNPGKIINPDADIMLKNLKAEHNFLPQRLESDLFFDKDEFALELGQCSGCGLCLSREDDLRMCPVFRAMGDELASSRAKANILRFWTTGKLTEEDFSSSDFEKFLDLCINCKACALQCPSGVDISKLMTTARTQYAKRKGLKLSKLVLSHNRYLSMVGSIFSPLANFIMRLKISRWLLEKLAGLEADRSLPAFASGGFLKAGRKYLSTQPPIENQVEKIAYFVDTYVNYNDHELGFAVLDVLRKNNIEVILPEQRPVPLTAACYGDIKTAQKDISFNVKHLTKVVRDGYKIICSEPSAALCLKQEIRHYTTDPDAQLISENTFELMNYLLGLFKQGKLKPPSKTLNETFAYHLPCHLLADGGSATIELLEKLCGVSIVDLNAGCCGLAGTFGMQKKNYDLSQKISTRLADALKTSSVKNILTECSVCKMQIEHISKAKAIHPVKIIAKAYNK